jgi:hypothetical protein
MSTVSSESVAAGSYGGRIRRATQEAYDRFGGKCPINLSVGGKIVVPLPPQFGRHDWQDYEPEAVGAVIQWVKQNPNGVVVDIGDPGTGGVHGIYSLIALVAGSQIEVIRIDSDLPRLKQVRRLCKYAQQRQRLRFVYGILAGGMTSELASLSKAIAITEGHFRAAAAWGGLGMLRYDVRFNVFRPLQCRLLDDLFLKEHAVNRPMLIRSEQGAHQYTLLLGGRQLLQKAHPYLILKVSSERSLRYAGHSREETQTFLEEQGYRIQSFFVGQDEHWRCEFKSGN